MTVATAEDLARIAIAANINDGPHALKMAAWNVASGVASELRLIGQDTDVIEPLLDAAWCASMNAYRNAEMAMAIWSVTSSGYGPALARSRSLRENLGFSVDDAAKELLKWSSEGDERPLKGAAVQCFVGDLICSWPQQLAEETSQAFSRTCWGARNFWRLRMGCSEEEAEAMVIGFARKSLDRVQIVSIVRVVTDAAMRGLSVAPERGRPPRDALGDAMRGMLSETAELVGYKKAAAAMRDELGSKVSHGVFRTTDRWENEFQTNPFVKHCLRDSRGEGYPYEAGYLACCCCALLRQGGHEDYEALVIRGLARGLARIVRRTCQRGMASVIGGPNAINSSFDYALKLDMAWGVDVEYVWSSYATRRASEGGAVMDPHTFGAEVATAAASARRAARFSGELGLPMMPVRRARRTA